MEGRNIFDTQKASFFGIVSMHDALLLFCRFLGVLHQNFEQRRQQLLQARKTR